MTPNLDLKVNILHANNSEMVHDIAIVTIADVLEIRIWSIEWRHFQ